jgi:hypothetical protein
MDAAPVKLAKLGREEGFDSRTSAIPWHRAAVRAVVARDQPAFRLCFTAPARIIVAGTHHA